MVVGRSCDFCAVTVTYSRKSYIDRAIPVQRLCDDRKVKVSSLNATYDVFNPKKTGGGGPKRPPSTFRAITLQRAKLSPRHFMTFFFQVSRTL